MPWTTPRVSWQQLRLFCEHWAWTDPYTKLETTGYVVPKNALHPHRVPFHIKYVTGNGHLVVGNAVCLKVDRRKHLRMLQFENSNKIEWCRDYLVIEVNGTLFYNN